MKPEFLPAFIAPSRRNDKFAPEPLGAQRHSIRRLSSQSEERVKFFRLFLPRGDIKFHKHAAKLPSVFETLVEPQILCGGRRSINIKVQHRRCLRNEFVKRVGKINFKFAREIMLTEEEEGSWETDWLKKGTPSSERKVCEKNSRATSVFETGRKRKREKKKENSRLEITINVRNVFLRSVH